MDSESEEVVEEWPTKQCRAAAGAGQFKELERSLDDASEQLGEVMDVLGAVGAEINAKLIKFGQQFQQVQLKQEWTKALLELLKWEYEAEW